MWLVQFQSPRVRAPYRHFLGEQRSWIFLETVSPPTLAGLMFNTLQLPEFQCCFHVVELETLSSRHTGVLTMLCNNACSTMSSHAKGVRSSSPKLIQLNQFHPSSQENRLRLRPPSISNWKLRPDCSNLFDVPAGLDLQFHP